MACGEHRIIVAGFGGQGVLTLGRLLCVGAMKEGRQVTYLPSYGTEVRGGTANCHVVVSDGEIFSPWVEEADSLIILNELSFRRFGESIREDGLLVVNASLVEVGDYAATHPVRLLSVPATQKAAELGDVRSANVFALGTFLEASGLCSTESMREAMRERFGEGPGLEINLRAFEAGASMGAELLGRLRTS